jgi:hypothetical protein
MVEPRILMVSREMVSLGAEGFARFLIVILTARSAVFIWGETEVMVPETMVPFLSSIVTDSLAHFMRNLGPVSTSRSEAQAKNRERLQRERHSAETLCSQVAHVPHELHFGGVAVVP